MRESYSFKILKLPFYELLRNPCKKNGTFYEAKRHAMDSDIELNLAWLPENRLGYQARLLDTCI